MEVRGKLKRPSVGKDSLDKYDIWPSVTGKGNVANKIF